MSQNALQSSLDSALSSLSSRKLRPLQKQAYLCSASCFDGSKSDASADHCVQGCQALTRAASQIVQSEVQRVQERIQREMVSCQDEVRDRAIKDQEKAQRVYQECGDKVMDKWVRKMGGVAKDIEGRIVEAEKEFERQRK
eukprot:CAMPEP_0182482058 /NCGR_PEP_ID=MMETSP1319-20130603/38486_1 /TAXON_ID=172717 /ORGANISM="Bolidomonas pacifica, Strain RCC208" /LENGTH=139 /DNA_ID=CAMNT_0024683737 /DNA_START=98 /DNA_END=514 /DNA_ORIENTATION=-